MHSDPREARREPSSTDYGALVQLSTEMLGIVDPSGRALILNTAWADILGVPLAQTAGFNFLQAIHPGDRERMRQSLRLAAWGEKIFPLEARCPRRGGGVAWISWRLAGCAGNGNVYVAGRDVTASKALSDEQLCDRRMTELGLVAAVVAHDFNNVLTIVSGHSNMMRLIPGLTPEHVRELDGLNEAVSHVAGLVQQVFAYGRRRPPEAGDVDLNKVIAQMGWMLRRLGHKNVDMDLVLGRNLGRVKAEEVQVKQVILNLAINARDAMPAGGRLLIETADVPPGAACDPPLPPVPSGGYVRLLVSDTGEGMTSEVQVRIFEPYFTTKKTGTGLGLFSVSRIVQRCGGHIRVRSSPGKGTTFEVYFPRADA